MFEAAQPAGSNTMLSVGAFETVLRALAPRAADNGANVLHTYLQTLAAAERLLRQRGMKLPRKNRRGSISTSSGNHGGGGDNDGGARYKQYSSLIFIVAGSALHVTEGNTAFADTMRRCSCVAYQRGAWSDLMRC